jgi:uncharacterized protein YdhG (YjbR/CyaY superfamily)
MYFRGSTTSKRFDGPDSYFKRLEPKTAKTMKAIFAAVTAKHKGLELVMAWNQPMLRLGKHYAIGLSVSKNHITINPFSVDALDKNLKKLEPYTVNKYTFQVPLDWKVDATLISSLAKVRISEIKPPKG